MCLLTCVFVLQFYFTGPHLKRCVEPILYFEFMLLYIYHWHCLTYILKYVVQTNLKIGVYFYLKVKGMHLINYKLIVNLSNDLLFCSINFTFKHV